MKRQHIIIATLALGLTASTLIAQEDAPPRQRGPGGEPGEGRVIRHRILPPPLVGTLDANHDGTISADEIANSSTALKALDKNGDGQITGDELRPPPPERPEGPGPDGAPKGPRPNGERKGPPHGPPPGERGPRPGGPGVEREGKAFHLPPPPVITALDANGDKTISADEIANAANALKTLDKNGDGALQKEELHPQPPPRGEN